MIIAVASGKGGTGKTTVSVNLAKVFGEGVQLLDCDVEEPNVHLFLHGNLLHKETACIQIPKINPLRCDACGDCNDFCEFNAIALAGNMALVFPELCHGCGGCALVCAKRAIREVYSHIGSVETLQAGDITLVQGRLNVGASSASPLINEVKKNIRDTELRHSGCSARDFLPSSRNVTRYRFCCSGD